MITNRVLGFHQSSITSKNIFHVVGAPHWRSIMNKIRCSRTNLCLFIINRHKVSYNSSSNTYYNQEDK